MESGYKVVLPSGKEVFLREFKIKHQEIAVQNIAKKAGDSALAMGALMQSELLKLLIVSINGEAPKRIDLENLDNLFSFKEYNLLLKVLAQVMGDDGDDPLAKCQIEVVSSGDT
jgi:hypothetical protein